ncbi:MAG: ABC-F family ATP-binding cassette domain-containing protein [Bryobacteraceae bacterium]
MALVLTCQSLTRRFGHRTVFENVSLSVFDGDRIGLIGPNGAGKSTLLRLLAQAETPDSGTVAIRKHARVAYVRQDPVFPGDATVASVLEAAIPPSIEETERLGRIAEGLGRGGFSRSDQSISSLSGGWRKRLAIAEALMAEPDLLVLDEPTNHLDVAGILWLENLLGGARFASVTVSHDRYFLENVATHMIEINRAYPEGTFQTRGNYSEFLERREEFRIAQARQRESLEVRVRREVEWLRRGPKARTGKSKARVAGANRLIGELADTAARTTKAVAAIDFSATDRKTKRLFTARNLTKQIEGRLLFDGLSFVLTPGVRMGLVGANGSGKTTLLRVIQGELLPDGGTVETADQLRIVYFDQGRRRLEPALSLKRALCPEGDSVVYQGRPIHVNGWAKRFLFHPEQLDQPVSSLSGGEQARVLIANLMLEPADLLLLDEPTNDLDIPTLEVLEDNLADFSGALVLVTHDRYLLDRVSTVVLALDGCGGGEFFADYSQWEQAHSVPKAKPPKEPETSRERTGGEPPKRKLSYLEAREYEQLEPRILEAEERVRLCEAQLQAPDVVADSRLLHEAYRDYQSAKSAVDTLYERWADLEAKRGQA